MKRYPRTEYLNEEMADAWTVQDLCKHFNRTPMTIHGWRERGLPSYKIRGYSRDALRFVKDEVLSWCEANDIQPAKGRRKKIGRPAKTQASASAR